MVIRGMRICLTRNVDQERGFVNGAAAIVEHVLRKDVFAACAPGGVPILANPFDMMEYSSCRSAMATP